MNKYLKKGLIISASVLMFLSAGTGINNVSAHRRYHYRYHRRAYRSHNKYGYWKHYWKHGRRHAYWYRYKSGYYHYGHWISYHHKSRYSDAAVTSAGGLGDLGNYKHYKSHRTRKHHYTYDSMDDSGIIDPSDVETPAQAGEDTENQTDNHPSHHSHFQVKFRKISGPSDDQSSNDTDTPNILLNEKEMKQGTLNDINKDREANGLSPVADSPLMDQIAALRARQANSNFTHYDANHNNQPYELEDANNMGINFGKGNYMFTENLAGAGLGTTSITGDPKSYTNNNGYDMADMDEDCMVNYDGDQGWGHRKNILYAPWRYVGIGVYASPSDPDNYTLAEDFATWASKGNGSNYNGPAYDGSAYIPNGFTAPDGTPKYNPESYAMY